MLRVRNLIVRLWIIPNPVYIEYSKVLKGQGLGVRGQGSGVFDYNSMFLFVFFGNRISYYC